jgi:hypothetical protein
MAELTEMVVPRSTGYCRHLDALLPAGSQPVALELVVLSMQQVYLMYPVQHAYVTTPGVKLVVIFQKGSEFVMIVKIFLKKHKVIVLLEKILANADCTCAAWTIRFYIENKDFLWQAVNVQCADAKPFSLLGKG